MMDFIADYFLGRKCNQINKNRKSFCSRTQANSIAILYESKDQKYAEYVYQELFSGKKVTYFCYAEGEKCPVIAGNKILVDSKCYDLLGTLKESITSICDNSRFDIIVDLSFNKKIVFKSILVYNTFSYRCGIKKSGYNVLDLRITGSDKNAINCLIDSIIALDKNN